MPLVCGIRFRGVGKVYHFAPGDETDLQVEDHVVVETARGVELGQVAMALQEIDGKDIVGELKPVVRRATTTDLLDAELYRSKEEEAAETCRSHVARMGLAMKIVSAEYAFDGSRLTFFFTSEDRVDFRDLVRELARHFRTRIELRQIGVRDEARIVGGLGKCGRPLCCKTWLSDFSPVSIRMAKQQDLPLSPMEISGQCGRLLCCLGYENDYYRDVKGKFPKVGKRIVTPIGEGKVVKISVLRETVTILMEDGSTVDMTADQVAGREPLEEAPARPGTLTVAQEDALDATLRPSPSPSRRGDGQAEEGAQRPHPPRPRGRRPGEGPGDGPAAEDAAREAPSRARGGAPRGGPVREGASRDDGRGAEPEGDAEGAQRSRRRRPRSRQRPPQAAGEATGPDAAAPRGDTSRGEGRRDDARPPARDAAANASPEGGKPSRRRSRPRRRRPGPAEAPAGDA